MLYLSLGTNLGDKTHNLSRALELIGQRVGEVVAYSGEFETEPWGFSSPNAFLNAAVAVETTLAPLDALAATQEIEREMGRTHKSVDGQYADRVIDIDLLLFDGPHSAPLQSPLLTLPHPHLHERRFVLEPLAEIAPMLLHPLLGETMVELLSHLNEAHIAFFTTFHEETLRAVNRLLPQLSKSAKPLTAGQMDEMLQSPFTHIALLRDEENVVRGMATLCLCTSPTGCKAWVEDVVVDSQCRRRGYGSQLVTFLIKQARHFGAKSINLTSRPEREAANRLYLSLGFEPRDTNVYCMKF